MGVLMIRASDHPSEPPRTIIVLESEVAAYEAQQWVRVVTDPDPTRARFHGLKFLPKHGTTGD